MRYECKVCGSIFSSSPAECPACGAMDTCRPSRVPSMAPRKPPERRMAGTLSPASPRTPEKKLGRSERIAIRRSKKAVIFDPPIKPKIKKRSHVYKKDAPKPPEIERIDAIALIIIGYLVIIAILHSIR